MHPTSCDEDYAQDMNTQAVQQHGGLHLYPTYMGCLEKNLSLCKHPRTVPGELHCTALQGFAKKVMGRPDAEHGDSQNRKGLINVRDTGAGRGRSV